MELLTITTLLAIAQFIYFGAKVGMARGKYNIQAPATTGNDIFERHYRVHYNTMEQLISFIPALWAFGIFVGELYAVGFGVIFITGRFIYAMTYVADPSKRTLGAVMSGLSTMIMTLGGIVGATMVYISTL